MKENKISITQKDGKIEISRNGELESRYHFDATVERIKEGKINAVALANMIAEIMCDCLNCKTASAALKDLNEMEQYRGTYFENIDILEE